MGAEAGASVAAVGIWLWLFSGFGLVDKILGSLAPNPSFLINAFLAMPIIALSSMVSPAAIERGRLAGFHDYVAKFDRPGLIAALKEQTSEIKRAA